ncbi:hypothetical protein NE619_04815 [Anaerovorax odorimutans]|uniref:Cyclic lactone autoinducer peptide n=1 Tax=Anaerovorax odorimutans TaxID=109327 RepID=A0ABT1RLH2_9FIRM|nr:hypothetical protein [Anaerovorax odorimutans]MCQ4636039.1 hypothetical protein [Anaerovorax odorimutans]
MNKKMVRNVTVGLVLVIAAVTAVQLSGLGDYLRNNLMLKCNTNGTCAMKYYKNYVKEK